MKRLLGFHVLLLGLWWAPELAHGQGTALTYQGRLTAEGNPANGIFDLQFTIYNDPASGTTVGGPVANGAVEVSNGLFIVMLDFGPGVFDGNPRWLEIGVRTNGSIAAYSILNPRQPVTASPYAITAGNVTGPINGGSILAGTITGTQLASGAAAANLAASGQSGVANGGVVLSEQANATDLVNAGYVRIGTASLGGEVWTAGPVRFPAPRTGHTAIWTGSEMIVWGGGLNTGGRYNPVLNRWMPTSTLNAPAGRINHTAVWTGSEMIIWGGFGPSYQNTGGRYNPVTDTWTPTSMSNVPADRSEHTAVWTGTEMIVFGGYRPGDGPLNTGGRYNPSADSWLTLPTSSGGFTVPTGDFAKAVWTGSDMFVVGFGSKFTWRYTPTSDSWSFDLSAPVNLPSHGVIAFTGGEVYYWAGVGLRYSLLFGSWSSMSSANQPSTGSGCDGVWTGTNFIIWCGNGPASTTARRYNPTTDTWTAVSTSNAYPTTGLETTTWTGSQMLVWGGNQTPVGHYDPAADSWTITTSPASVPRSDHVAVWTGAEMLVWGGSDGTTVLTNGGRYNPALDLWLPMSTNGAPPGCTGQTAVWSGSELIIWGGYNGRYLNAGGRYSPASDTWVLTSTNGAPIGRTTHSAVWTGSQMVVWGGTTGSFSSRANTGGLYDPVTDTWTATTTNGAPTARAGHSAIWTGSRMLVWGGQPIIGFLNNGALYDPGSDTWSAMSTNNAGAGRAGHIAVWTGSEMLVWGGNAGNTPSSSGARYNLAADSWQPMSNVGAPTPRQRHTGVWARKELIVWGGSGTAAGQVQTGGRYDTNTDTWLPTTLAGAPPARDSHTAVWTGEQMLVFGGSDGVNRLESLFHYAPPKNLYLYLKQ